MIKPMLVFVVALVPPMFLAILMWNILGPTMTIVGIGLLVTFVVLLIKK